MDVFPILGILDKVVLYSQCAAREPQLSNSKMTFETAGFYFLHPHGHCFEHTLKTFILFHSRGSPYSQSSVHRHPEPGSQRHCYLEKDYHLDVSRPNSLTISHCTGTRNLFRQLSVMVRYAPRQIKKATQPLRRLPAPSSLLPPCSKALAPPT